MAKIVQLLGKRQTVVAGAALTVGVMEAVSRGAVVVVRVIPVVLAVLVVVRQLKVTQYIMLEPATETPVATTQAAAMRRPVVVAPALPVSDQLETSTVAPVEPVCR